MAAGRDWDANPPFESGPESPGTSATAPTPTGIPALPVEFGPVDTGGTGDGQVQIAYCHSASVSHSWHNSLMNMVAYDKSIGMNLIGSAPYQVNCSGPHGLVEGRNLAAKHFLEETEHEWLFWIDTDMGFEPDSLDRLMTVADQDERPVVGGLCFALKQLTPDGTSGWRTGPAPTLFGLAKNKQGTIGFFSRSVYPRDSVVQVAGTGSAFILIHRSVLEQVRDKHGEAWYDLISYEDGKTISEDLSFCWRVGDLGRSIWVHTGVKTTHHKTIWVGEEDYAMPAKDEMFGTERVGDAFPA